MRPYALTHLNDAVLIRDLDMLVARERDALAAVIAHLAEVDARRLYLPAGYPSMYEYCVRKLGWSEQAALKRLRAARTARRFPAVFATLAAGQLTLSTVVLLAPHLTGDNVDEILAAAAHRTRAEVEQLIAHWFPEPDVPARLEPIAPAPPSRGMPAPFQLSPGTVPCSGNTDPRSAAKAPRLAPLAPERFLLRFTIGKDTYEKLRSVQELLSHQLPSGDVVQVFERALDVLKAQLEKRKFAATANPRPRSPGRRTSLNPRHIPASVKRAVWKRDGGRCTFVNAAGERCRARRMLEFDHVDPVALGGRATVSGVRILCRGHNQFEADRRLGATFMNEKRRQGRRDATTGAPGGRGAASAVGDASPPARPMSHPAERFRDVVAGLRGLGFRAREARQAVARCETALDATTEERLRAALRWLCPGPGSCPLPSGRHATG